MKVQYPPILKYIAQDHISKNVGTHQEQQTERPDYKVGTSIVIPHWTPNAQLRASLGSST